MIDMLSRWKRSSADQKWHLFLPRKSKAEYGSTFSLVKKSDEKGPASSEHINLNAFQWRFYTLLQSISLYNTKYINNWKEWDKKVVQINADHQNMDYNEFIRIICIRPSSNYFQLHENKI